MKKNLYFSFGLAAMSLLAAGCSTTDGESDAYYYGAGVCAYSADGTMPVMPESGTVDTVIPCDGAGF